jgi:hypothetical protein
MLTHEQIARLRKFADDERYSVAKRLTAIDRLACDAGLYVLRQTRHLPIGSPGTRSRREIIRLLRRLLKSPSPESKRVNTAGIEQRLMLIQTGVSTSCALREPTKAAPVTPPNVLAGLDSLDTKLKQLEQEHYAAEENNGTNSL